MPSGRPSFKLGSSWVVEGDEGDSEAEATVEEKMVEKDPDFAPPPSKEPYSPMKPRQRTTRRATRSPEPELVMPSIDVGSMDGSWAGTNGRTTNLRKSPRINEKARDGRMRKPRRTEGSSSPEELPAGKPAKKRVPKAIADQDDMLQVVADHLTAMLSWSLEVLGRALRLLKTPISYLLAIWMLFGLGIIARNLITTSIHASLSPICRIPGTSFLNLPFCPGGPGYDSENVPPVEFDQLMTVQAKFEEVLDQSAGSISLPMDMKRGEASIRDLRQLVKYSHINSKNELLLEFDGFVDTAKIASYDLQKFNSHIGRAVDSVLATTRWTTRVLDGIQERVASRGAISAFINDKLLAPFQPVKFTETALLDQYIKHTQIVEEEINKLIDEAQALLMVLASLEDRLEIIHGIVIRDKLHARAKKEEILSELWSMVGGNRGKLSKMEKQLSLLQQVGVYRKSAYAHVSETILKLQAIGAGLEDLRERVGAPELLRDRLDIPLSVHIDNIQQGVARLEEQRQSAKKAENEVIRQTLERGQLEGTLIDG